MESSLIYVFRRALGHESALMREPIAILPAQNLFLVYYKLDFYVFKKIISLNDCDKKDSNVQKA